MPQKISDGIVASRTVLECVMRLQRQGCHPAMQQLESTEPELTDYLLESLSSIYHDLSSTYTSPARVRRIYRKIELVTLVCVQSLQQSHFELWQHQMDDPIERNPTTPNP